MCTGACFLKNYNAGGHSMLSSGLQEAASRPASGAAAAFKPHAAGPGATGSSGGTGSAYVGAYGASSGTGAAAGGRAGAGAGIMGAPLRPAPAVSLHDPHHPEAVVLNADEWAGGQGIKSGRPVAPVVVDPYLARHLR